MKMPASTKTLLKLWFLVSVILAALSAIAWSG
jgi:hypothetical protein